MDDLDLPINVRIISPDMIAAAVRELASCNEEYETLEDMAIRIIYAVMEVAKTQIQD